MSGVLCDHAPLRASHASISERFQYGRGRPGRPLARMYPAGSGRSPGLMCEASPVSAAMRRLWSLLYLIVRSERTLMPVSAAMSYQVTAWSVCAVLMPIV